MNSTVEIKYVAYVTTELEGKIVSLNEDCWPPTVTLSNNETVELNISDKLSQEFIQKITIHKNKKDETCQLK